MACSLASVIFLLFTAVNSDRTAAFRHGPSAPKVARSLLYLKPTSLFAAAVRVPRDQTRLFLSADEDGLLFTEPALNAFITAEVRHFVREAMFDFENGCKPAHNKWRMESEEKLDCGLTNEFGDVIDKEYANTVRELENNGDLAIDIICNTTRVAFEAGFNREQGLLSALGAAICFFRNFFRQPRVVAACERVGVSDYAVAHHMTDMYHHRFFRGAYTKTLAPSGKGEIAARTAVGLPPATTVEENESGSKKDSEDECLVWSPTTPGLCLHWKSEDEDFRRKRFERIQMEGTRDPRRGGSGTTR